MEPIVLLFPGSQVKQLAGQRNIVVFGRVIDLMRLPGKLQHRPDLVRSHDSQRQQKNVGGGSGEPATDIAFAVKLDLPLLIYPFIHG